MLYNNGTQLFYNDYAGQLNKLIDHSSWLILFSLIIGTALFLFVASFWNKNYMNDMGILMSLGEKKGKIVLQRLLECSVIAAAAMLASVFLGNSVISALLVRLTPKPVSVNAENVITPFLTGEYDIVQRLNVAITGDSILKLVILGIVLLLIFSVLPAVLAMRYHPRQIFQKTE